MDGLPGGRAVQPQARLESAMRARRLAAWLPPQRNLNTAIAADGDPDGALDALLGAIQQALFAEPTLGGLVSTLDCELSEIETLSGDGAETFKAALIDVVIEYETGNSLD